MHFCEAVYCRTRLGTGNAQLSHQEPHVANLCKALPHRGHFFICACSGGLEARTWHCLQMPSFVFSTKAKKLVRHFHWPHCVHLLAFVALAGAAATRFLQRARRSSFVRFLRKVSSTLKSASVRFVPFLAASHLAHASGFCWHDLQNPGSASKVFWHQAHGVLSPSAG